MNLAIAFARGVPTGWGMGTTIKQARKAARLVHEHSHGGVLDGIKVFTIGESGTVSSTSYTDRYGKEVEP